MEQTFTLKKGEMLFERDKIIISDKAKLQRYMTLFVLDIYRNTKSSTFRSYTIKVSKR